MTCPACGFSQLEEMPATACVIVYTCRSCHATLRPSSGDCCIFCSHGSMDCPPKQTGNECCTIS